MTVTDRVILIIDASDEHALRLKDMIEFMDAPEVRITVPEDWLSAVDDRRLAAVFLTESVSNEFTRSIISKMAEIDPNVPIVVATGGDDGE